MSLASLVGLPPMQITAPGSIPDRYRQGYEDFYNQNPNDYQRIGGAAVSYVTTPQGETIQFGNTGGASNFRRYLESIGENPIANPGGGMRSIMPIRDEPILGQPLLPKVPDYSSQFEKFGEQLGGFGEQLGGLGEQMTGYQDALGSFNEQMGGMGKQFETVNNKLDSVEKGIANLGNQLQPRQQQYQNPYSNFYSNPFGFGGLGSLFGRRY
jgi:hypothetical protein